MRAVAALLLCVSLTACSPAYVVRAGYEEARMLWGRQPIERLLADANLPSPTRSKLELVVDVRSFAAETLQLRAGDSYTSISEVNDEQVVHVVSAAPRFELRAHTWWFPIVGRIPYKGFFSKEDAVAEARTLEGQGLDTYVRPALAFSTLGWFADPLPSTLLRYEPEDLAEAIIHELLHNTTYLAGRAEFDESFATFVGYRGAMQYFAARDNTQAGERLAAEWRDDITFSDFLAGFMQRLQAAYATGISPAQRLELFEGGQAELSRLSFETSLHRDFATRPLNNAVILQQAMYAQRLRLFEELHVLEPDLPRLIAAVVAAIDSDGGDPFVAVEELVAARREESVRRSS